MRIHFARHAAYAFILIALLLLIPSQSNFVFSQTITPFNITNNFGKLAENDHNFTWATGPSSAPGIIQYSPKDNFVSFEKSKTFSATAKCYQDKNDSATVTVNKVELNNLTPGIEYVYRVGSPGNFSSQGIFRTAPNDGSGFTFLHITDTQGASLRDYTLWKNTLNKALAKFPSARFLVHTGDMVDDGQYSNQWNMFEGSVSTELLNLAIEPTVGNHEVLNENKTNTNARNFVDNFDLPISLNSGAPAGTVYSFDYGNAHFAVLNTECAASNLKIEAEWLKSDMLASKKQWKIVALHRGPYGATYDSATTRGILCPVFDTTGVDLILQGHDHNYVRSTMKGGIKVPLGKGPLYITSNSGGVKFYPLKPRSWQSVDLQPMTQMFTALNISNNKMYIKAYDIKYNLVDSVTLQK